MVAACRDEVTAAGVVLALRRVGGRTGTVAPRDAVNPWRDGECRLMLRAGRGAARGPRNKPSPAPAV